VLQRRLVKGFIVSLDRDMRTRARRYWRTLSNGFIPYASQVEVRGSTFQGVELTATPAADDAGSAPAESGEGEAEDDEHAEAAPAAMYLPIGYVLSSKTIAYARGRDGRPRRGRPPGYHHVFRTTGSETHREREYVVDVTIIEAHEPPSEIGPTDRWIEVDLGTQALVAYEGRRPVYATLVSTGRVRDPDDPLRDMRTPTGVFRITSKHVSHTMDGDHAVDGPYSIEDVPYVMYFQLAYALHSAFWHDGFGRPRSHGCVNLAPLDARWIFRFAGPPLPEHWHGVYPTPEQPGTRLWIHGETPEG
jgi:lipoprotein-anchoring transpeptidase ErfK/SrfK